MKLSIIVPVYNVEQYLRQCIESILNQSMKDFELILVDDGSTDNSGRICDEYEAKDDRIRVIHKENSGPGDTRKKGILMSKGEYVGFVDSDDWIETDMYERMYEMIIKTPVDVVICGTAFEYENSETEKQNGAMITGYINKEQLISDVYPIMLSDNPYYKFGLFPSVWNKLWRKDLLKKHINTMDNRITMGEDVAVVYPCLLDAESIYVMEDAFLYHYRILSQSTTRRYKPRYAQNNLALFSRLNRIFTKSEFNYILIPQLNDYIVYMSCNLIRSEFSLMNKKRFKEKISFINSYINEKIVSEAFNIIDISKVKGTKRIIIKLVRGRHLISLGLIFEILGKI